MANDHICLKIGSLFSKRAFIVKKEGHIYSGMISALYIALSFREITCCCLKYLCRSKKQLARMGSFEIQVPVRVCLSVARVFLVETKAVQAYFSPVDFGTIVVLNFSSLNS